MNRVPGRGNRLHLRLVGLAALFVLLSVAHVSAVGDSPKRVISTAPSITEMIYALNAEDLLVGVTSYCDYPPEAATKPIIGDFASPSIEAILRQKPNLLIVLSGRQDLEDRLSPFGIPLLVLEHESIEKVFTSIQTLGRYLDREREAGALVSRSRARLAAVRDRLTGRPVKKVLFLVGRNLGTLSDIYAVGSEGYLGELIRMAGGESIFPDLYSAYPKVSIEEILVRNPEIIIDMSHSDRPSAEDEGPVRELWSRFPTIEAVKQNHVQVVDSDIFLIPGPRVVDAVEMLAVIIHGDPK